MPLEEPPSQMSRAQTKATCIAHICPNCGTDHQVSVEQILRAGTMTSWCHCRACGHSWHPVAAPRS